MKYNKPKPSAWQNSKEKPQDWGAKEIRKPYSSAEAPAQQADNNNAEIQACTDFEKAEVKPNWCETNQGYALGNSAETEEAAEEPAQPNDVNNTPEPLPAEPEYDPGCSDVYGEPAFNNPKNEASGNYQPGNQKTLIMLFALVVALIVFLCVIIVFLLNERGADKSNDMVQTTFTQAAEETTEETVTETEIEETTVPTTEETTEDDETTVPLSPVVTNAGKYTGYWYIKGVEEKELAINFIGNNEVNFTLSYFRLASMDDVTATLNGSTASFFYNDYGSKIKGTLTFNNNSITVDITQSDNYNIPAETITFNTRQLPTREETTRKTQTVTSPNGANNASAEFETIVVNNVEFVYPRTYSDESITFAVNSLEINLLHRYPNDEYELKIDGEIRDKKNRSAYLTYYEYDESGYLLGKYMFSSSRVSGAFKERHQFNIDKNTARVVIDMGIGN